MTRLRHEDRDLSLRCWTVSSLASLMLLIGWLAPGTSVGQTVTLWPAYHMVRSIEPEIGGDGSAIVAWLSDSRGGSGPDLDGPVRRGTGGTVRIATRSGATGPFGYPRVISGPGVGNLNLGMADNGRGVVTWTEPRGRVRLRILNRGAVSRSFPFSPLPVSNLAFDMADDGSAVLAWQRPAAPGFTIVEARTRFKFGRFSRTQRVGRFAGVGPFFTASAGPRGRGTVVWSGVCPLFDPRARRPARAALLSGRHPRKRIQSIRSSACPDARFSIDTDQAGNTILIINGSLGDSQGIRAAWRPPTGGFKPATWLSPASLVSDFGEVAFVSRRRALLGYSTFGPPESAEDPAGQTIGFKVGIVSPMTTAEAWQESSSQFAGHLAGVFSGPHGKTGCLSQTLPQLELVGAIPCAPSLSAHFEPIEGQPEFRGITGPSAAISGTGYSIVAWHGVNGMGPEGVYVHTSEMPAGPP
jgi:hypothetical protein